MFALFENAADPWIHYESLRQSHPCWNRGPWPWWNPWWPVTAKEDPVVLAFDHFLNAKEPPNKGSRKGHFLGLEGGTGPKTCDIVRKVLWMDNHPMFHFHGVSCLSNWGNIDTVQSPVAVGCQAVHTQRLDPSSHNYRRFELTLTRR